VGKYLTAAELKRHKALAMLQTEHKMKQFVDDLKRDDERARLCMPLFEKNKPSFGCCWRFVCCKAGQLYRFEMHIKSPKVKTKCLWVKYEK
jgi:hypothetical protein